MTDPYAVLGLTKTATAADIKAAHRKLVKISHPDLNPDDPKAEAKFKAISGAYDLLKDPGTRARFDAGEIDATGQEKPQRRYYRDYADQPGNTYQRRPQGGDFGGGGFGGSGDPGDVFAEMLRQRGARGFPPFGEEGFTMPGQDLNFALEVGFLDSVLGAKKKINLPEVGHVEVQIPKGAVDGLTLRLRGKGMAGTGGGPAGDALITLTVQAHPVFRREGDDIHVVLPITLDEAVLGAKVSAPTIDGPVTLTVPAGASSGRVLRLRGRGVARAKAVDGRAPDGKAPDGKAPDGKAPDGKASGDQLVELRIVAPAVIDDHLRQFMEGWRKSHAYDPRKDMLGEDAS